MASPGLSRAMKQLPRLMLLLPFAMLPDAAIGSPTFTTSEVTPESPLPHVFRCDFDTLGGGGFRFRLVVLSTHPGLHQEKRVYLKVGHYPGSWLRSQLAPDSSSEGLTFTVVGSREMASDAVLIFSHNVQGSNHFREYEFPIRKWITPR